MNKDKINRKQVVNRHNPKLAQIDATTPLTVGNGFFAYTFDVTGMQTLGNYYKEKNVPLCTMAEWAWHIFPYSKDTFLCPREDLELTTYESHGRTLSYAVKEKPGNEEVYKWHRHNPHRFHMGELGLIYEDKEIIPENLSNIKQELDLYNGMAISNFDIKGSSCEVHTVSDGEESRLGFLIKSKELSKQNLKVRIRFGYPSQDISGVDWNKKSSQHTQIVEQVTNEIILKRVIDQVTYFTYIRVNDGVIKQNSQHEYECIGSTDTLELLVEFRSIEEGGNNWDRAYDFLALSESSKEHWQDFWNHGGIVDFSGSTDKRAFELERRIILSLYLTALQCCGEFPPQETGLTCNSWYGKFHLEMHLWHAAHFPLWNRGYLLERSIPWYEKILSEAKENASRNGFKGARWPKMVGPEGIDSPSEIATLLVWQQPHIVYMLELLYQEKLRKNEQTAITFMERHWELIKETANFMVDFAVKNSQTNKYELLSPLIPAQECYDPVDVKNPAFELEYWKFGLKIAYQWALRLKAEDKIWKKWIKVSDNMAIPAYQDGVYLSHENCPDTFEHYNTDHPSMVAAFGLLPGEDISPIYMKNTLNKICECWHFDSMWGWDFAMMAMTATRLGWSEKGIDFILMEQNKNSYVVSGNNYQRLNDKLPLYLPGNGSLLLSVAMMIAGYGMQEDTVCKGFPQDGSWKVRFEEISGLPY
jgi:hypothetical protein